MLGVVNYRYLLIATLKISLISNGLSNQPIGRIMLKTDGKRGEKWRYSHIKLRKSDVEIILDQGWDNLILFLQTNNIITTRRRAPGYLEYDRDLLVDVLMLGIMLIYGVLKTYPSVSLDNNEKEYWGVVVPGQLTDFPDNAIIRCSICDSASATHECTGCGKYFCASKKCNKLQ